MLRWFSVGILLLFLILHTGKVEAAQPLEASAAVDKILQRRTQEFVLRWLPEGQQSPREIVRQQYTFSPPATNQEIEDYRVKLDGVTALELEIVPDISGGGAIASLPQMRLA